MNRRTTSKLTKPATQKNFKTDQTTIKKSVLLGFGFLLVLACLSLYYFTRSTPVAVASPQSSVVKPETTNPVLTRDYVGAKTCQHCHAPVVKAWQDSHHALAMQEANLQTVLGDFNNATFKHFDVKTTFFKRDGKFRVRTDGADGKLTDYPISYTFGVTPLQQYLIEFPGGRYQALSIAWDSRPKAEGGQRWFHLYPNEKMAYSDQLHWTKRYQNWNMECAECHSTDLKKNYDAATDSYKTTFKEINVACESCHGPASLHIKWADTAKAPYADDDKGLVVKLDSDWQHAWKFSDSNAAIAVREHHAPDTLMNTCWACHSRRSTLQEGSMPGLPLEDSHLPALLTQPTYYADGQQHDEDYTWGSFRQSRMFQKGVTCMDCHEPHSLKLRAEGNALCTRCHNAAKFDSEKHHFHKLDSRGASCMDCHAPEQNYMVVDGRHDHSFRLPRPDLSSQLGTPNACSQCHSSQKSEWAAGKLDKWYGKVWRDRPHYGTVLQAGVTQGIKALPSLVELAHNADSPAIVRATATSLITPLMNQELLLFAREQLQDADPMVRVAALGLIESADPINRTLSASPLLADPIRAVRIEAARILADVPESQISADRLASFKKASTEYLDFLKLNADWPAQAVNLGNYYLRQGNMEAAITGFQRALTLDPQFVGAYVNLSDAYRRQGNEAQSEQVLHKGISLLPDAADLHHALGLLLVRKHDNSAALEELAKSSKLAPDNDRYAYVYGIALNSSGKQRQALSVLKAADLRHPNNLELLSALISINRELGDTKTALVYARKAGNALPDNKEIQQLILELETVSHGKQ